MTQLALRDALAARFRLREDEVRSGPHRLKVTRIADFEALVAAIDTLDPDERMPYWADVWASAVALCDYLGLEPPPAGARVLDLGCGLGLCGLAAAAHGARATLMDLEIDALRFARWNAWQNGLGASARAVAGDWRRPPLAGPFDLVLGADILYERRFFEPVRAFLEAHVATGGTALLAEPCRPLSRPFFEQCRAAGLRDVIAYASEPNGGSRVEVHELRRRRP